MSPPDPASLGSGPTPSPTLFDHAVSPLDDVWVALDLETTGLSADGDEIIEVGAVKFQGREILDTFQSFVDPNRRLSAFIERFTGITQSQVDAAPPFSQVGHELVAFLGDAPVVGHNVAFDLGFLAEKGLRLSNPSSDTWDLAFVLLPGTREYSLAKLASSLGVPHPHAHRALEDALVTREVFLRLGEMAEDLDVYTLAEMERLGSRSSWVLAYLLRRLETHKLTRGAGVGGPDGVGATGLDIQALRARMQHRKALRPNSATEKIDPESIAAVLGSGGALARTMPGFEERAQQTAMARAVAQAVNAGTRLIVEAGTGVGKSLAYLLPAVSYALRNNSRVVVSTNTINLQEQLLSKDVPALVDALAGVDGVPIDDFKYTVLKGRANYLCLRRWSQMRSSDSLNVDEARLLSKTLVWLRTTESGDRSELNLSNRRAAAPWDRVSAQGAVDCSGVNGVCFLRSARDRAAAAHLVIVNHALLMADLTAGRALIPDHDILIVDEAQHLEEMATRHLGFEVSQPSVDDHLQLLGSDRGLLNRLSVAFRGSAAADTRRGTFDEVASRIAAALPSVRRAMAGMFAILGGLLDDHPKGDPSFGQETRITRATRSQPAWSDLEIQWESVDVTLADLQNDISALLTSLEGLEDAGLLDYEDMLMETVGLLQQNAELRQRLAEVIPHPEEDDIYWMRRSQRSGELTLNAAPIHVGDQLEKRLYSQKRSVILTSATLSANGTFDHVRERTGFSDADALLLGSPFDYPRAALLCVPGDMPEPSSWAYQAAVEQAIVDAAVAAGGSTMALFTSHASLQAASAAIRANLQSQGLDVLAQGLDGTPHQLLRRFVESPRSVLLGTSSFWEGVDLAGDSLKVLLVARLPFSVPTEPVFEARSEGYEDAFSEYALPQAILRLRQGFGRLIRTRSDRGVVVILDKRTVSRRYGKSFVESLPPVTLVTPSLYDLGTEIRSWLDI